MKMRMYFSQNGQNAAWVKAKKYFICSHEGNVSCYFRKQLDLSVWTGSGVGFFCAAEVGRFLSGEPLKSPFMIVRSLLLFDERMMQEEEVH